jgi:RNA polymerase sigma-70 factor (ECF subfamily)
VNNLKEISNYIDENKFDLDRIIDDFTPYVRKIINNMSGETLSIEDKEEIISDTFFILWKNKEKDILLLDSYIAGITRNLVKEKLKKRKITYNIQDYENTIDYYNDNVNLFSEERIEIENSLKVLKDNEIKILNMFYYSSKSTRDIANELNISEINVSTKLSRIRKKLKKELNKGGHYGR